MTMTTFGRAAVAAMAVSIGLAAALSDGALAPLTLLQATVSAASAVGAATHAPPLPPGSLAR